MLIGNMCLAHKKTICVIGTGSYSWISTREETRKVSSLFSRVKR